MWPVVETETFADWFDEQNEREKTSVRAHVKVLAQVGPMLGRPHVDSVKGSRHSNMKELRVPSGGKPIRIFFAFDPARSAVLLIAGNKAGKKKFYEKLIPEADRLFDERLEEFEKGDR